MRIYLAARYSRREEMCGYAELLRAKGYTVDARWLSPPETVALEVESAMEEAPMSGYHFAQEDIEDLDKAGVVVCFTEVSNSPFTRGGRHVEYGYALAKGKTLFIVGPRENVFYCLPQVIRFNTWEDFISQAEKGFHYL